MHLCSTFSDCCQLATPLNAEVQKNGKRLGFTRTQSDRIIDRDNIWHVSLSVHRGSAIAHQIWPSSVKGVATGAPKCRNLPKIVFLATGSRHSERIHMKLGV